MDKFEQLHLEIQELKAQQASDYKDMMLGLIVQRDRTRELGGGLRLVAATVVELAQKVDEIVESQSRFESLLSKTDDRWGKMFGALETMVLDVDEKVATKADLADVIRRVEALESRPPAA